jgi:hypothetical protein
MRRVKTGGPQILCPTRHIFQSKKFPREKQASQPQIELAVLTFRGPHGLIQMLQKFALLS